jgi:muramoyltetrapeptide carboxypeptidase LdcA involved in peptidoglycan recycling
MEPRIPRHLRAGDQIRVVAPSTSLAVIPAEQRTAATGRLEREFGFEVTFGAHAEESGPLDVPPIDGRVADLHEAFADPDVAGILTVLGGYQSNHLVPFLDYEMIAAHPKVFCGYSDITALQVALLARANLVTYSGPHYTTFAMRDHNEATVAAFRRCVLEEGSLTWTPSPTFTDDAWYADQDDRTLVTTEGWWVMQPGSASGRILGGNLCTVNLLQGTRYLPSLRDAVLVVEDDEESSPATFDRDLTSLLQQPGGNAIRGLVVGRFQRATGMTRDLLAHIVATKPELAAVPVLANVDIGHTSPLYTFPIGGECWLAAEPGAVELAITRH